jgi:hypothetical protein
MRRAVYLFIGLLIWGLVDDFLVSSPQLTSRAAASDDDEYMGSGAVRAPRRLAEDERIPLRSSVHGGDDDLTFAGASRRFLGPNCQVLDSDSLLYVFMSLQI